MKKTVLLICLALLLGGAAAAQRDPDVPVLKRRPAPEQDQQPSSNQSDASEASPAGQPEDSTAEDSSEPVTAPPEPPAPRRGQDNGERRSGDDRDHRRPGDSDRRSRSGSVPSAGSGSTAFHSPEATSEFIVTRSGGVVRMTVNDPQNAEEAGRISMRLRSVAAQFARGDFDLRGGAGASAPGAAQLRELRGKVTYTAHSIEDGAELIISSQDPKAVTAIHQFLEFHRRSQPGGPSD
jgi:hypothetical protein